MKKLFTTFVLTILMLSIMSAQKDITDFIEKKIVGKEAPGFQYIIADTSGILFEYYGGYANIQEKEEVSAKTEFKVYSATKTFTSLAIMQLVEEGKINLDDEVGEILGIEFSEPVTIRQILAHTGGMTPSMGAVGIHLAEKHDEFDIQANNLQILEKYTKLISTPGKKEKYSNFGYLVLGEVIEKVSGKDYEVYIQENIFNKLGEGHPYSFRFNDNTAKGYQNTRTLMHYLYGFLFDKKVMYSGKEKHFMGMNDLYLNTPSFGGAFSNVKGLLHYGQSLAQADSPLLSDKSKEQFFEEQLLINGKSAGHNLGWLLKEKNGVKYYSHPGGGGGFCCEIRIYPELGIVSAFMMNSTQVFPHLKLLSKLDGFFL